MLTTNEETVSSKSQIAYTLWIKLLRESFAVYCGLTRLEGLVSRVARGGYPVYTKKIDWLHGQNIVKN